MADRRIAAVLPLGAEAPHIKSIAADYTVLVIQFFRLIQLKLNRCLTTEHRDRHLDVILIGIQLVDNTDEVLERTVDDTNLIAYVLGNLDDAGLNAHLIHLRLGERNRL